MSVHKGPPTNTEFLEMESTTSLSFALSICKLKRFAKKALIAPRTSSVFFLHVFLIFFLAVGCISGWLLDLTRLANAFKHNCTQYSGDD